VKTANVSYRTWHDRLGHLDFEDLKKVEILGVVADRVPREVAPCDVCTRGKMERLASPKDEHVKATTVIQRIHSNASGYYHTSYGGARYFVTFIDEYSNFVEAVPLKSKGSGI